MGFSGLTKYRIKKIFTGAIVPPKKVSSIDELVNFLKNNTHAIGYLEYSKVTPDFQVVYKVE